MNHATAKEIALDLGVSHHAVEKRLKSARQKLGVATSLEAARLLAEAEGYGRTASQPPEVDPARTGGDERIVGGVVISQSPPRRRRQWIIGASIMSMIAIAALALTPLATDGAAEQPDVFVVDKSKEEFAAQFDAAVEQSFNRLDKNSSGVLEAGELPNASVRTIRVDANAQAAPTTGTIEVADADTNGDGRVSRAEYKAWFSSLTAHPRS